VTTLEVSALFVDGQNAWVQVACRAGLLVLGDRLTQIRYPDGAQAEVALTVTQIVGPSGPTDRLDSGAMGHVYLTGNGVPALRPVCLVETAAPWQLPQGQQPWPPPAAVPWGVQPLGENDRPELYVRESRSLSRVTTAFRLILAVPHLIVLYALQLAAEVVVVIGWFAAVFTGRLPSWAAEFLQGYVGWLTRVYGYLGLLTDQYPPFAFEAPGYPIDVRLPPAGRLGRLSVLFRAILVIPAWILMSLVLFGWLVASIVIWLIVLIAGRFPPTLFWATASIQRFGLRVNSYLFLLTSRYPRGLFGDPEAQSERPALILSRAAKRLIALFLVLGVIGWAGYVAGAVAVSQGSTSKPDPYAELVAAHHRLASLHVKAEFNTCRGTAVPLVCVQRVEREIAARLDAFKADIDAIEPPPGTEFTFVQLSTTTQLLAKTWRDAAQTSSPTEHNRVLSLGDPDGRGRYIDQLYQDLLAAMRN
jgi:uncharacterized protein DUF4389